MARSLKLSLALVLSHEMQCLVLGLSRSNGGSNPFGRTNEIQVIVLNNAPSLTNQLDDYYSVLASFISSPNPNFPATCRIASCDGCPGEMSSQAVKTSASIPI